MTAYLITFRPETESPKEGASLPELLRRARESAARKPIVEAWAFHAHQPVAVGDRVFLLLQGAGGPAICGYGSAAGPLASVDGRWQLPVAFEVIVDPTTQVLATREELLGPRGLLNTPR